MVDGTGVNEKVGALDNAGGTAAAVRGIAAIDRDDGWPGSAALRLPERVLAADCAMHFRRRLRHHHRGVSLSFLGAGVDPEISTWGNMLRDGQRVLQSAWWLALFLGIALVLAVLTLNLLGDALRDALDPRARSR